MSVVAWILCGLAAARLWRVWDIDDIGQPIHDRVDRLLMRRKDSKVAQWLFTLLSCPFCLPFYFVVALVATGLVWSDTWLWQLIAGSFGVSYVVSHVASRLDVEDA